MYIILASIKGEKTMTNEEIMNAMACEMDGLYDSVDSVQAEKDAGFLLYEDGCWNQYYEEMSK